MYDWKTSQGLYKIVEVHKTRIEEWPMIGTGVEIKAKLKAMNEMNGYIPGVGGDRNYNAWAVLIKYID